MRDEFVHDSTQWLEQNIAVKKIDAEIYFKQAVRRITDNNKFSNPHPPLHAKWLALNLLELALRDIETIFENRQSIRRNK